MPQGDLAAPVRKEGKYLVLSPPMSPPARSSLSASDHASSPGDEPDSIDELSDFRPPRHLGRPTLDAALGLVRAARPAVGRPRGSPCCGGFGVVAVHCGAEPVRLTDGPIVFTSGPATAPLIVFELVALGVMTATSGQVSGLSAALLVSLVRRLPGGRPNRSS